MMDFLIMAYLTGFFVTDAALAIPDIRKALRDEPGRTWIEARRQDLPKAIFWPWFLWRPW